MSERQPARFKHGKHGCRICRNREAPTRRVLVHGDGWAQNQEVCPDCEPGVLAHEEEYQRRQEFNEKGMGR